MLLAAMWSLHIRRLAQARRQTSLICALEPGSASKIPAKLPKAATVPRLRVRVARNEHGRKELASVVLPELLLHCALGR